MQRLAAVVQAVHAAALASRQYQEPPSARIRGVIKWCAAGLEGDVACLHFANADRVRHACDHSSKRNVSAIALVFIKLKDKIVISFFVAFNICKYLIEEGSSLNIYDPKVKEAQIQKDLNFENFKYANNISEAIQGVDGIVILTDWEEFRSLNYHELYNSMRKPSWLFDCRGVIDKKLAIEAGLKVWVVGNGT